VKKEISCLWIVAWSVGRVAGRDGKSATGRASHEPQAAVKRPDFRVGRRLAVSVGSGWPLRCRLRAAGWPLEPRTAGRWPSGRCDRPDRLKPMLAGPLPLAHVPAAVHKKRYVLPSESTYLETTETTCRRVGTVLRAGRVARRREYDAFDQLGTTDLIAIRAVDFLFLPHQPCFGARGCFVVPGPSGRCVLDMRE
jgi:hypothetical protein